MQLLKKWVVAPMFIAGGVAYWSRSTNWYNGSDCTKPKCIAPLTTTTPNNGRKTNRAAIIPTMVHIGVSVPFKPDPFIDKESSLFNQPPKRKKRELN